MSTLGFPSYSSSAAAAVAASRKFHEGNGMTSSTATYLQPNDTTSASSSTTAYPYFTTPGADLYSVGSAAVAAAAAVGGPYASNNGVNVNSSATGVFSSRTLQPTRPRSKSRANAGKIRTNNQSLLTHNFGDGTENTHTTHQVCTLEKK